MTNVFSNPPYYDDFNEDKRFIRIGFRPGYAVQARELTQISSIIQNQIKRFGDHVFKDGAMVIPGGTNVQVNVPFVKLETQFASVDINVSNFLNKTVVGKTSGAVGKIILVKAAEASDPPTLYVNYTTGVTSRAVTGDTTSGSAVITGLSTNLSGLISPGTRVSGSGVASNSYVVSIAGNGDITLNQNATSSVNDSALTIFTANEFTAGETIVDIANPSTFQATVVAATPTGVGSTASISAGIYYVNGFFVKVEAQTIILEKYSNTPSNHIGLRVSDVIIDPDDDSSLNDPAQGFTNFNAPGADRWRIDLTLEAIDYDATDEENFVSLIKIKNGVVERKVENSEYSELEKTFARRTFDESGNYTVKAFGIDVRESLDDGTNRGVFPADSNTIGEESKLAIGLEPGKAYVKGFEIQSLATTFLLTDKGRDTLPANNVRTFAPIGSYVFVNNVLGTFDISALETVDLKLNTDSNGTSAIVGTARVRSWEYVSGTVGSEAAVYKLWLFDIDLDTGVAFEDIKFIEVSGAGASGPSCRPVLESGLAILNDTTPSNNSLIFKAPYDFIKTFDPSNGNVDTLYDVVKIFSGTTNGSGEVTINTGSDNFSFTNVATNYHVSVDSSGVVRPVTVVSLGGTNNRQSTLTVGVNGTAVTIIAKVNKTVTNHVSNPVRSKTVTNRTQNALTHGATVALDKADVFEIVAVIDNNGAGIDVTDRYTLDNGQRDNYYGQSKLIFKSGATPPTGTLEVEYNYFAHGTGDYFSVDSYAIDYEDIPEYKSQTTGQVYKLRDCLDFRPRINDAGTGFTGTGANVGDLPVAYSDVIADFDYYLSRIDKVCLSYTGEFFIQRGISAVVPVPPTDPDNAMVLYMLTIPPFTVSPSDVNVKFIENKRYTMRDIGKLERRIGNLEYYTALNLLEKQTADLFIDDGTGNNRFKNGFIVDNFTTHLLGDSGDADYRCSIDVQNNELRAPFFADNLGLVYSSGSSSNITQTGNLLTLPYSHVTAIDQPFASRTFNVNEFLLFEWVGQIALTPDSDDWKDTDREPDLIVQMADNFDLINALAEKAGIEGTRWNNWQTEWIGTPSIRRTTRTTPRISNGDVQARTTTTTTTTTQQGVQSRTGVKTEVVPNTVLQDIGDRVVDVSLESWIRAKTISFSATRLKPNTRVYAFFDGVPVSAYITPSGGTLGGALITDNFGAVSGTFAIPNTDTIRFRTGVRQFRLSDQSDNSYSSVRTSANVNYQATGLLLNKEKTILSTRVAELSQETVTQSNSVVRTTTSTVSNTTGGPVNPTQRVPFFAGGNGRDPLAQTFLVENSNGIFVTKIDLFFKTKSSTVPIAVQIRATDNGYPSRDIVPFSTKTLNPSSVNISSDASTATTFTFESPVFLQGNTEYAFVILANSTEYEVWSATLGQNQVGTTARIIEQPNLGSIFLSQNNTAWTPQQDSDVKFKLYRADFNTAVTGSAILENAAVTTKTLGVDPISTTNASNVVKVYHPNHGLLTGSLTTLAGATSVNGVDADNINGQHTVTVVDLDNYTFTYTVDTNNPNASATGSGGGTSVTATHNIQMDVLCPTITTLNLPQTEIGWTAKTTNQSYTIDSTYNPIENNENNYFVSSRLIASADNQAASMLGKSLILKADLTSELSEISPVIDLTRASVIAVGNRINNDVTNETSPKGAGAALAKYLTRKITLEEPANILKILFAANVAPDADIAVYYKVLKEFDQTTVFDDANFVAATLDGTLVKDSDPEVFRDCSFTVSNLDNFASFVVKIVMRSTNTAQIVRIKDLRILALS